MNSVLSKNKKMITIAIKSVVIIISVFCIGNLSLPLFMNIVPEIALLWIVFFAVIICITIFFEKLWSFRNGTKTQKIFFYIIYGLLFFSVLFIILAVYNIEKYSKNTLQNYGNNVTIVIMGCQVYNDEPSPMLKARIDVAIDYLKQHPTANVIGSGRLAPDDSLSEGETIKKYLVENGIEEERIFVENKATNSEENMIFSAKIIKENNLANLVLVATDSWHQMRSQLYAKENGLIAYSLSCNTMKELHLVYYLREILAHTRLIFT